MELITFKDKKTHQISRKYLIQTITTSRKHNTSTQLKAQGQKGLKSGGVRESKCCIPKERKDWGWLSRLTIDNTAGSIYINTTLTETVPTVWHSVLLARIKPVEPEYQFTTQHTGDLIYHTNIHRRPR